ncbi:golgin subfamily A member 6-like protein 2 [Leptopilina boulardi]|uniref:golgin subfamily A member 6-like protein 2 n=1 Tax=Leptopilina boulardi TaxID=63433 RepID=UPI0021F6141E|nr:golgin subfamily A member 6-like protein 2 [Leptopilina boulardi]
MSMFVTPPKKTRGQTESVGSASEETKSERASVGSETASIAGKGESTSEAGSEIAVFDSPCRNRKEAQLRADREKKKEGKDSRGRKTNKEKKEGSVTAGESGFMKDFVLRGEKEKKEMERGEQKAEVEKEGQNEGKGFEEILGMLRKMGEESKRGLENVRKELKESRKKDEERCMRMDKRMEGVLAEMAKIRDMWIRYEEEWREEKNNVWEKLGSLEKEVKEMEEERRNEVKKIEDSIEGLECLEKRVENIEKIGEVGNIEGMEELKTEVRELKKQMEFLEKEKRGGM